MSAQLSYDIDQAKAYEGQVYALALHDIISRAIEDAAGVGFAKAVSRGTDKEKQVVIGGADFAGITVRALDREGAANDGSIKYNQYESAALLRDGYIWAICPTGCNPGDVVNYHRTTGVLDAGAPVAGESSLDGAEWDTVAAAGELGVIRLGSLATTDA